MCQSFALALEPQRRYSMILFLSLYSLPTTQNLSGYCSLVDCCGRKLAPPSALYCGDHRTRLGEACGRTRGGMSPPVGIERFARRAFRIIYIYIYINGPVRQDTALFDRAIRLHTANFGQASSVSTNRVLSNLTSLHIRSAPPEVPNEFADTGYQRAVTRRQRWQNLLRN